MMIGVLREDGTINFELLESFKGNFEKEFAKKQLGTVVKEMVIKAIPGNSESKAKLLETDSIKTLIDNSVKEIATEIHENKSPNSGLFYSIGETIKEYVGMESAYRMDRAVAIAKTTKNQEEAIGLVKNLFSVESFTNKDIKARYKSEFNNYYSTEAEEIVITIAKEVGAAVSEAETKNAIIGETVKVIAEEKEKIREELGVDDEEDDAEENEDDDTPETSDGSETEYDNDEDDPSDEGEDTDSEDDTDENETADDTTDDEKPSDEGTEDLEITNIEESLKETLDRDIENGSVTIGFDIPESETESGDVIDVKEIEDEIAEKSEEEYKKILFGNLNMGKAIVPLSPTRLDDMKIPSVEALAGVFVKSTEGLHTLKEHIGARFGLLKNIVDNEKDEELTAKYNNYYKTSMEAFDRSDLILSSLNKCGLSPYGVENYNDFTSLYIGSKYIHTITEGNKLKNVSPKTEFKSAEDAVDAIFDIAYIKKSLKKTGSKEDYNDLTSRESLFWENFYKLEEDDAKKEQIKNLMNLQDLQISPKVLVSEDFYESLKAGISATSIKTTSAKTESEANEILFNNSKERIEAILGRSMSADQEDIIRAIVTNKDPTDYIPTPFEKFIIKLGKDANGVGVSGKDNGGDFELGNESYEIFQKAKVMQTLYSFVNIAKPMTEKSTEDFNNYLFGSKYGFKGII